MVSKNDIAVLLNFGMYIAEPYVYNYSLSSAYIVASYMAALKRSLLLASYT